MPGYGGDGGYEAFHLTHAGLRAFPRQAEEFVRFALIARDVEESREYEDSADPKFSREFCRGHARARDAVPAYCHTCAEITWLHPSRVEGLQIVLSPPSVMFGVR